MSLRKKVLITGIEGFVGSHLKKALEPDYDVVGFDIANSVFQNITCKDQVMAFFDEELPHIVIHLAANPDVSKSSVYPQEDLYLNTLGTINMLEACKRYAVESFVLASTAVVYGEVTGEAFQEDDHLKPTTPYGIGKLAAEQYCNLYFRKYGIPTTVFRLFNIFGARQSRKFAIPNMISRIAQGEERLKMYGSPKDSRDFIYIADVCRAFKLAIEKKPAGMTFNLASGSDTLILDVANMISEILGKKLEFYYDEESNDDSRVSRILGNAALIKEHLGWEPEYSLQKGLSEMIETMALAEKQDNVLTSSRS